MSSFANVIDRPARPRAVARVLWRSGQTEFRRRRKRVAPISPRLRGTARSCTRPRVRPQQHRVGQPRPQGPAWVPREASGHVCSGCPGAVQRARPALPRLMPASHRKPSWTRQRRCRYNPAHRPVSRPGHGATNQGPRLVTIRKSLHRGLYCKHQGAQRRPLLFAARQRRRSQYAPRRRSRAND
jgi:hypothetical protein